MSNIIRRLAGVLVLLSLLSTGCSLKKAIQQSSPERRHFVLAASRGTSGGSARSDAVLYVRDVRVSPRYEGAGFVYKQGKAEYTTDFYNRFLIPPDLLITQEARDWVLASNLFGSVIQTGSVITPTHALEGRVNALYGDYTVQPAKAVFEVEFFLIEDPLNRSAVVFQKRYREEIALDGQGPENLAAGWNEALSRSLSGLENDLGAVELRTANEDAGP